MRGLNILCAITTGRDGLIFLKENTASCTFIFGVSAVGEMSCE